MREKKKKNWTGGGKAGWYLCPSVSRVVCLSGWLAGGMLSGLKLDFYLFFGSKWVDRRGLFLSLV
jgi:hypothetical protein